MEKSERLPALLMVIICIAGMIWVKEYKPAHMKPKPVKVDSVRVIGG